MLAPSEGPLAGYRFLIIEDDMMQACHLRDMLVELGGTVEELVLSYQRARNEVDKAMFDCALLDINLGGTLSFHIAEVLQYRGIPFIVCTAYGDEAVDVHPSVRGVPRLSKPVAADDLRDAVLRLLAPASLRKGP
jgi:DNA-binding NtrC family response regulator